MYIIWIYTCNHRVYLRCFLHLTFYFFYSLSQSLKVMSRLMRECWYHNPAARLTTLRIKKSLDNLAKAEDMKFWFVIKRCSKQSKLMNYHPFLFRSVHVEHVWMMWAFRIFFIRNELLTGRHLWYISVWQCLFRECENLDSVCTCIRMLFDTRFAIGQNMSTTGCYFILSFVLAIGQKKNVYTSLLFYCIFWTSFSHIREIYSSNFTEKVFHVFKCIK